MLSVIIRILVIIRCSTLPFLGSPGWFHSPHLWAGSILGSSRNNSIQKPLMTYGARWKYDLLYCSEPMITDNKRHLYSLVSLYVRHDSACNLDRNFVPNIQYIGIYNIYADILILHAQRAEIFFSRTRGNRKFSTIFIRRNHFSCHINKLGIVYTIWTKQLVHLTD